MIQKFGDLAIDPSTVIAVSSHIIGPVVICRPSVASLDVINIPISDESARAPDRSFQPDRDVRRNVAGTIVRSVRVGSYRPNY